jgi:dipeptidyl aminopeptidase/acylaminoacyl peptidase
MKWTLSILCIAVMVIGLAGCGGGGEQMAATPSPPDATAPSPNAEVGPFVIQTAATAGFEMQSIPNDFGAAFVALHGARLDYVAVQEMLDRIVYRQGSSQDGLFVSDLFGGNRERISNGDDFDPNWSPGGDLIVTSNGFGSSAEIIVMDTDGSNRRNITNNSDGDYDPAFSPDGYMIAYYGNADGDREIYLTSLDGDTHTNLTDNASEDLSPEWTPDGDILFVRSFDRILRMVDDGTGETFLTDPPAGDSDDSPHMSPDGTMIAFSRDDADNDIHIADADGSHVRKITQSSDDQLDPAFSTCGRYVAYTREEGPDEQIYVQELAPPHRSYAVVTTGEDELQPDLGSPTVQISRVLVGPGADTDRGFAPYHSDADAAILAHDADGYLNFVKIVLPGDRSTLEVTPLPDQGDMLVGVSLEADWVARLHQDDGPGEDTMWNFKSRIASAAVVYLDAYSGDVVSVIVLKDSVYPSGEGAGSAVTQSATSSTTVVNGPFQAVYDAAGELVAEGDIGTVEIDAAGGAIHTR